MHALLFIYMTFCSYYLEIDKWTRNLGVKLKIREYANQDATEISIYIRVLYHSPKNKYFLWVFYSYPWTEKNPLIFLSSAVKLIFLDLGVQISLKTFCFNNVLNLPYFSVQGPELHVHGNDFDSVSSRLNNMDKVKMSEEYLWIGGVR